MMKKSFDSTLIILTALVCSLGHEARAQQCPSDPEKIKSMIGELRDTFECSGLNFRSCNEYRGLVISGAAAGGVAVGGALAAKTAAGIALMKSKGIVCPLPGTNAGSPTIRSTAELFALLALGDEAHAKMPGVGCSIDKEAALKVFDGLRRESSEQAQRVAAEMKDRMIAEKLSATDLSKVSATDLDRQKAFTAGLDSLEKEIKSGSASTASKERALEAIARAKSNVASGAESAMTRIVNSHQQLMGLLSEEIKDSIGAKTREGLSWWNHSDSIRAEKSAKVLGDASAKVMAQVQIDLDRIRGMGSNSAGRAEVLKGLGYKPEFITKLLSVDDARKTLNFTASSFQGLAYEVGVGNKFKGVKHVPIEDLRNMTFRRSLPGMDWALRTFRELPGMNNSLSAVVRRVGAEAIAKTAALAEGRLGTMVKYVAPVVTGVGKAMALPVQVVYETATFTNSAHCGGEIESPYARKTMVEYAEGKESCRSINERTDKTDEFLYGLSPAEQLQEVRNNPASCDLLARLYQRYAPSQNWEVTCQGTNAQLTGKTAKGEGQMIRFDAASGTPQNIEWYSGSFKSCAKVSMKDDVFDSAQVFDTETGMNGCGSVGTGKTIGQSAIHMRQNTTDEKQMVKQFSQWQDSNAYVMSAATDCCRTGDSGSNPMCSNVSRDSNSGSGRATRK